MTRQFSLKQPVMAKNWSTEPEWVPVTIIEELGPLSFKVKPQDGTIWKHHVDHFKPLVQSDKSNSSADMDSYPISIILETHQIIANLLSMLKLYLNDIPVEIVGVQTD